MLVEKESIFGIENIPVANHIKNHLDKIKPDSFKKIYDDILVLAEQVGFLEKFLFLKEYLLVAVDGVQYHSDMCLVRKVSYIKL